MRFSKREVHDLLISWIVLSVAFTILRQGGIPGILSGRSYLFQDVFLFPKMFAIVGTAFVLHELSHKYVAQTYNLKAEYQKWTQGLIFAFILSLTGFFLFAAPGAVMIMGAPWVTPEIEARISLAGPIANITVGIVALLVRSAGYVPFFLTELALINFFLAVFNLLPIYPMDGSKVLRYNMMTWVVAFGSAVVLLFWAL
jgi:Zn-dependent protease